MNFIPREPAVAWWSGMVECRICSHRHAQVIPIFEPFDDPVDTECPNCGNMTCDPLEIEEA